MIRVVVLRVQRRLRARERHHGVVLRGRMPVDVGVRLEKCARRVQCAICRGEIFVGRSNLAGCAGLKKHFFRLWAKVTWPSV